MDNDAKLKLKLKQKQKQKEIELLTKMMFDSNNTETNYSDKNNDTNNDTYDHVRKRGKGRTGASDFTKGKCCFARPCTVGWKSQNQPLNKSGNRTPL
jgi:hypothetical protein